MKFILTILLSVIALKGSCQDYTHITLAEHRAAQQFITVEGGRMAYIDEGEGNPILLVHGVPTSSWLYRHMIDSLVMKGYRVVAPDLLGFGNSDKPKGYEVYAHKKQAERLFTLMDSLKIEQWDQVIHDAGGLWTWEMMMIDRVRIKRLIILNTITHRDGFNPPFRFGKRNFLAKFTMKMYGSRLFGKGMMKKTLKLGLTNDQLTKDDINPYWIPMHEGAYRPVFHFFTTIKETCSKLDLITVELQKSNFPCVVIWGKRDDILIGEKQIPHLKKNLSIPDNNVMYLNRGTHFIQEEQYGAICDKIDAFLKED